MVKYLEELLLKKTKDSQSEILYAQWSYDKKVIPSALQVVSNLFPHYSLHDESHSVTIINNIVRILGLENIEKLSAIDIWLLLEAAYCHDIGMVVKSEELTDELTKSSFINYFNEISNDPKNGLFEFASKFYLDGNKILYKNNELDLKAHDGIKFILAEYFRRLHAERSKDIISNPFSYLSIHSPRGVIPKRIIEILGDICACHTKNFEDVLNLPFCEVGIDIEDAHPRFIACLLRVGDLLDLDNNRFSEVMLRTLSKVPLETLNHKNKHLSIKSFRVDKSSIEIYAQCNSYDTASITQHWFNYLNSEISNQMINWNRIVPSHDFGYLPTIGNLQVKLIGFEYLDGKNKPKFTVDTDKALALLQGAGLYGNSFQSLREILQNSTDATLIRIWLDSMDKTVFSKPTSDLFSNIFSNYPIDIEIRLEHLENGDTNIHVTIIDNGIGISSEELYFLMNTGSSFKNVKKKQIVNAMPNWLKPSGTFGIGFQSIFLLTDEVKIETKSFFDQKLKIIEFNSPNSKKDGNILVKYLDSDHSTKPGSKLAFTYLSKKSEIDYNKSFIRNNDGTFYIISSDYFSTENFCIEYHYIYEEIRNFASMSNIPIRIKENNSYVNLNSNALNFIYFNEKFDFEFNIRTAKDEKYYTINATFYYKNQRIDERIEILFLNVETNIHTSNASEVLTLNRNNFNEIYGKKISLLFYTALLETVAENFESIFSTEEEIQRGSMFLYYYNTKYKIHELSNIKKFLNLWHNHEITIEDINYKLIDLFTLVNEIEVQIDDKLFPSILKLENDKLHIGISDRYQTTATIFFIINYFIQNHNNLYILNMIDENKNGVIITKEPKDDLLELYNLKTYIINRSKIINNFVSSRSYMPSYGKYNKLRIKDDVINGLIRGMGVGLNNIFNIPKMVAPFTFGNNPKDRNILDNKYLYSWVFQNKHDQSVTLIEIENLYNELENEAKMIFDTL